MTTQQKKEAIQKVIFERAYELMEKAEEYRGIIFHQDANHEEISNASLKKAIQECKENKPVFNQPLNVIYLRDYMDMMYYLRSKGYALPWMGISVEKQIKLGWIKLKNNE